jgi:hypothetical protein
MRQSVNRSKFSIPEDVLFSETGAYNGLGVIEFQVFEIPPKVSQDNGPTYVFFMTHQPEENNYSHSEIWSDREERTYTFREPSRTVSLTFRTLLCQCLNEDRMRIAAIR